MIDIVRHITLIFIVSSVFFLNAQAAEGEQAEAAESDTGQFALDPELSGREYTQDKSKQSLPVILDERDEQKQIKLETEGRFVPYLGASKSKQPAEDIVPLLGKEERDVLKNRYNLETGLGVSVKKNIDINLGYRITSQPTLLDDAKQDPDSNQIRFGVHFNY